MRVTKEILEKMKKDHLTDDELLPEYYEDLLRYLTSREKSYHDGYSVSDYYGVYAYCGKISSEPKTYYFGCYSKCIKYRNDRFEDNYIFFRNQPFNVSGDFLSQTLTIGEYTFKIDRPFSYNYLIIMLKYADQFSDNSHLALPGLCEDPILITKEIQDKYVSYIDVNTPIQSIIGYCEFNKFDVNHISYATPCYGACCIYPQFFDDENTSLRSIYDSLSLRWIDSPFTNYDGYNDNRSIPSKIRLSDETEICGDVDNLIIYVYDGSQHDSGYEIRLYSNKDYYNTAAFLIVAYGLARKIAEPIEKVLQYWPSCPLLREEYSLKRKLEKYQSAVLTTQIKPAYDSVVRSFQAIWPDRVTGFEELLAAECITLVEGVSDSYSIFTYGPYLENIINREFDYKVYENLQTKTFHDLFDNESEALHFLEKCSAKTSQREQKKSLFSEIIELYNHLLNSYLDITDNHQKISKVEGFIKKQREFQKRVFDEETIEDTKSDTVQIEYADDNYVSYTGEPPFSNIIMIYQFGYFDECHKPCLYADINLQVKIENKKTLKMPYASLKIADIFRHTEEFTFSPMIVKFEEDTSYVGMPEVCITENTDFSKPLKKAKKIDALYTFDKPIVFECKLVNCKRDEYSAEIEAEIVGITIAEKLLNEEQTPDFSKAFGIADYYKF